VAGRLAHEAILLRRSASGSRSIFCTDGDPVVKYSIELPARILTPDCLPFVRLIVMDIMFIPKIKNVYNNYSSQDA
jgi:hypothetical protein